MCVGDAVNVVDDSLLLKLNDDAATTSHTVIEDAGWNLANG